MNERSKAIVNEAWHSVVNMQVDYLIPKIEIRMHPEDVITIRLDRDVQIKGVIYEIEIGKNQLLGFPIVQDATVPIGKPYAKRLQ